MKKKPCNIYRQIVVNALAASVMLVVSLYGVGCTSDFIEYISLDSSLSERVIHFDESMVYLVFDDPELAQKYGFVYPVFNGQKIRRELVDKYSANDIQSYCGLRFSESVKEKMSFRILAGYRVRHNIIKREFAPEYTKIVLLDENNVLSVCSIHAIPGSAWTELPD